jgi:penicillin amidase
MKKILLIILIIIIVIIIAIAGSGYYILHQSVPARAGKIKTSAVFNSVEITFDKMGIPQIWAKNEHDAFFSTGYLQASDRLFQMDMTRRVAQGRLAELLGEAVLEIDIQQRRIGHRQIAETFLDKLSESNRNKLQAFIDGINFYVQNCDALPFEYQLLRMDFDEWTLLDCISILSFQTWFSDALMSPDAFFVKATEKLGIEKAKELNVTYPDWAPTVVPDKQHDAVSSIRSGFVEQLIAQNRLPFLMSNSSNSWVIAPEHSESGSAMLASDPHLEITRLPQFWYYLGLHIKDKKIDALGITTPGLPVIIMGHNTKTAWAFTVSGVDVSEYFAEKINPEDSTQYLTPEGWANFKIREETIRISGKDEPAIINVRSTRHGPVMFNNRKMNQVYALHWAGFDINIDEAFSAGFSLIENSDFEGFQHAVTKLGALDASWTYADCNGNIGYQLGTPVAVRPKSGNNFPVPGWTDEYEWQGFHPLSETPHALNPAQGWLATCNNKADQTNLNYDLEGFYAVDRILSITSLLNSRDKFSVSDMQSFQMDLKDHYLLRWVKMIVPLLEENNYMDQANQLRSWNGITDIRSQETAFISLLLSNLKSTIFHDEIGDQADRISNQTLETIFKLDESPWFDDINTPDVTETKDVVFRAAVDSTNSELGNKSWGDIHTLTMSHPFAVVPGISSLLNLKHGPFPWAGTPGSLNASFFMKSADQPGHFNSIVGPSWRFVIDFSDIDGAAIVLPAGNSGNPMSSHFMDFFDMWKSGARWNVPASYTKVKEKTETILYLEP